MARTKSFRELVQKHVKGDKKFAEALLREGVDAMLSGDVDTGKTILRDYIKATVGFCVSHPGCHARQRVRPLAGPMTDSGGHPVFTKQRQ